MPEVMPHFDCWLLDEIPDLPADLDAPIEVTSEELKLIEAAGETAHAGHVYRLRERYEVSFPAAGAEYPAGALVLYDGEEVILIWHESGDGRCGQSPRSG